MAQNLLLVGESWVSSSTHFKGFDFFSSTYYATGGDFLIAALGAAGMNVTHLPSHDAAKAFPFEPAGLQAYDAVILSDIGANTLLLPPETFLEGKRTPNRLQLLKEYVGQGGGLVMAGGYLSFQGIYGSARYHRTVIEEVLPVSISPHDDRLEKPEGVIPRVVNAGHPIVSGLEGEWPYLLGYNEVQAKPGADTLAVVGDDPLLVVGTFEKGRTVAWTSDVGPHWCPRAFVDWPGYQRLWGGITKWVSGSR